MVKKLTKKNISFRKIITGSNNITIRKANVKPYSYDKMYVDKHLAENYQLIDHFNERNTNHKDYYFSLLNNTCPFYDENGRTCKILFNLQLGL